MAFQMYLHNALQVNLENEMNREMEGSDAFGGLFARPSAPVAYTAPKEEPLQNGARFGLTSSKLQLDNYSKVTSKQFPLRKATRPSTAPTVASDPLERFMPRKRMSSPRQQKPEPKLLKRKGDEHDQSLSELNIRNATNHYVYNVNHINAKKSPFLSGHFTTRAHVSRRNTKPQSRPTKRLGGRRAALPKRPQTSHNAQSLRIQVSPVPTNSVSPMDMLEIPATPSSGWGQSPFSPAAGTPFSPREWHDQLSPHGAHSQRSSPAPNGGRRKSGSSNMPRKLDSITLTVTNSDRRQAFLRIWSKINELLSRDLQVQSTKSLTVGKLKAMVQSIRDVMATEFERIQQMHAYYEVKTQTRGMDYMNFRQFCRDIRLPCPQLDQLALDRIYAQTCKDFNVGIGKMSHHGDEFTPYWHLQCFMWGIILCGLERFKDSNMQFKMRITAFFDRHVDMNHHVPADRIELSLTRAQGKRCFSQTCKLLLTVWNDFLAAQRAHKDRAHKNRTKDATEMRAALINAKMCSPVNMYSSIEQVFTAESMTDMGVFLTAVHNLGIVTPLFYRPRALSSFYDTNLSDTKLTEVELHFLYLLESVARVAHKIFAGTSLNIGDQLCRLLDELGQGKQRSLRRTPLSTKFGRTLRLYEEKSDNEDTSSLLNQSFSAFRQH